MHSEYTMMVKRFMGWPMAQKMAPTHESKGQVDALVAEEGCQHFGVGPHREPDCQRIATILYLAFGCEFSVHVTSYCDDSQ